ncbi:MarR family winged helix-turn-helix transcriptional regulator [Frigidibacter mobilis]|uniref:MarR family transcriptional regulator n=1 Tax=Frigidibacter mobilis TaxID=1335048 RepID=A0A161HBE8_9RHOB|nr:MarR family transcriptional regulator [Frigidibacter mobilis]AMY67349.1 MarR family transcriptional regulator [Frigidibacter mobilis]
MTRPTLASHTMPGHLIRRLHQISTQLFMQRVAEAGLDLTPVQFAALDAIGRHPGIDQAGLADQIAKDRATIGAVVDRLERKGLVTRIVSQRDKRARELTLSEEGRGIVTALMPVVAGLQRDILPGLTEDEYRQFIALAEKAQGVAAG